LAKSDGSRFAPEELIDLWFEHCPANSQSYLEEHHHQACREDHHRETDKACKLDSLSVPTTKIEADDLDEEFLLSKLEGVYTETLPYLWLLLNAVVTSWNRSEKQKEESSACKESRARFVEFYFGFALPFWLSSSLCQACVVVISILLFTKNRATNAFQILMGLFLGISGATKRVLSVCNHMGVSISYE
jgi:hypothetical protein